MAFTGDTSPLSLCGYPSSTSDIDSRGLPVDFVGPADVCLVNENNEFITAMAFTGDTSPLSPCGCPSSVSDIDSGGSPLDSIGPADVCPVNENTEYKDEWLDWVVSRRRAGKILKKREWEYWLISQKDKATAAEKQNYERSVKKIGAIEKRMITAGAVVETPGDNVPNKKPQLTVSVHIPYRVRCDFCPWKCYELSFSSTRHCTHPIHIASIHAMVKHEELEKPWLNEVMAVTKANLPTVPRYIMTISAMRDWLDLLQEDLDLHKALVVSARGSTHSRPGFGLSSLLTERSWHALWIMHAKLKLDAFEEHRRKQTRDLCRGLNSQGTDVEVGSQPQTKLRKNLSRAEIKRERRRHKQNFMDVLEAIKR